MSEHTVNVAPRAVKSKRSQFPRKDCKICGTDFQVTYDRTHTCSRRCASMLAIRNRRRKAAVIPLTVRAATGVIFLIGGGYALVDSADLNELMQYGWGRGTDGRAYRGFYEGDRYTGRKHRYMSMHRQLASLPAGISVDHIDCNPLNNRRSNLRSATPQQQQANQRLRKNNTTGIRGVTWNRQKWKWNAQICIDGKHIHLGNFDDKDAAAAARCKAAKHHFGEFSREGDPDPYYGLPSAASKGVATAST